MLIAAQLAIQESPVQITVGDARLNWHPEEVSGCAREAGDLQWCGCLGKESS